VFALIAFLSSLVGFALLALSYDRMVDRQDPALGARVSTGFGKLGGSLCLLGCGAVSVYEFGWGFGLIAWVGWLAVGALFGVGVLTLIAVRRGPLPRVSRRKKYRPNAPDSRDLMPQQMPRQK
jgi:hypothetical protein